MESSGVFSSAGLQAIKQVIIKPKMILLVMIVVLVRKFTKIGKRNDLIQKKPLSSGFYDILRF